MMRDDALAKTLLADLITGAYVGITIAQRWGLKRLGRRSAAEQPALRADYQKINSKSLSP